MKKFVLPGFYELFDLNQKLVIAFKEHNEWFQDNTEIECFFGNFQFCAWDGGRIFGGYKRAFKEDIIRIKDFFNSNNVPLRLVFTNPMLEEKHLLDPYCNQILYLLNDGFNQVLVNSDLLKKYIKTNYSNFKICSSTTKCLINPKDAKQELDNKDYYQVCLDYNLNRNMKFLNSLSPEEKDQTEFLCNAICPSGCLHRKEHYRLNGLSHLNGGSPFNIDCSIAGSTIDFTTFKYHNNLSPEDINEYEKLGFSHFKLEGRTLSPQEVSGNYLRYLIKPKYQIQANYFLNS